MIEEYSNERKPTDGEIYRKVRQYEREGNSLLRRRWLSRLTQSKQDRMKQLNQETNEQVRGGFDRLLVIPGLWPDGMKLSLLHRLIALASIEVGFPEPIHFQNNSHFAGNAHISRSHF